MNMTISSAINPLTTSGQAVCIGIDAAKHHLDVAAHMAGNMAGYSGAGNSGAGKPVRFSNDEAGFADLLAWLAPQQVQIGDRRHRTGRADRPA